MKHEIHVIASSSLSGIIPLISLRGVDEYAREGGDVDFLVPPGLAVTACGIVAKAAQKKGWYLANFRNIGYLAQIVLIRPSMNGIGDTAIKIDFFDGLRWYGVGKDLAGQRLFNELVPLYSGKSKLAGAAGFLQKLLIVGQVTDRDWARVIATGADESFLEETAKFLGMPVTRNQIDTRGLDNLAKWRLRAASGSVRGLWSALTWFVRVSMAHLKFKMGWGTRAGLVIGVSGLDGSGKSTVINRLLDAYRMAGGNQPQLVHLLPSWVPLPHQIFRRKKTSQNYTRPYSEPPVSSKLSGWIRLAYYLCAFALTRLSLLLASIQGKQIILDRSFLDFASDLTRARIPQRQLPGWLMRLVSPCGKLFYLDASPSVVVARKGELTLEKATSLQMSYLATAATLGAVVIDGDNNPDMVFSELLSHISQEYMQRIDAAEISK